MRIGVVGCFHETNTFAPGITRSSAFSKDWYVGKESFVGAYQGTRTSMGGVIDGAATVGAELIPMFYTQATPSSLVSREAMAEIEQTMLQQLKKHSDQLDGLVVILHGAMVSEQYEDADGALLEQIRWITTNIPISVTIDLHANVSELMVENADYLVGYDTYPHIDAYERAVEAVDLLARSIKEQAKPVTYVAQTHVLIAPTLMDTNIAPMQELMEMTFTLEKDPDVLNISVVGGFAFADVRFAGFQIIVTCNDHAEKAKQYAQQLAAWVQTHAERFKPKLLSPEAACKLIQSTGKYPAVLIESSDNVGGGSPADATHTLRYLYENHIHQYLCVIADREAVELAFRAGVGHQFKGTVGGKVEQHLGLETLHGEPVFIEGRIRLLSDGNFKHHGPYMTGMQARMGRTAVIELPHQSVLILTEERVAPWDINHVRSVGIDPNAFEILVVKAAVAWRAAFGEIAQMAVELDTPGCTSSNLDHFMYKRLAASTQKI